MWFRNELSSLAEVSLYRQTFSCEFHVFTPVRLRVSSFLDKILRHCVTGFDVSRDRSLDPCRWWDQDCSKSREPITYWHSIISQKNGIVRLFFFISQQKKILRCRRFSARWRFIQTLRRMGKMQTRIPCGNRNFRARNDRMILRHVVGSAIRIILISNIFFRISRNRQRSLFRLHLLSTFPCTFQISSLDGTDKCPIYLLSQTYIFRRVRKIAKRDY